MDREDETVQEGRKMKKETETMKANKAGEETKEKGEETTEETAEETTDGTAVVDRIEGTIAVCERADRTIFEIPLTQFAQKPREGDVVRWANGRAYSMEDETKKKKEEAARLFERLSKGGR